MTVFGYTLMICAVQLEITLSARISGRTTPKVVFLPCFISINNDIQANSRTSETSQQNSVGTSQVNLSTADTCSKKTLTALEISALAFVLFVFQC